MKLFSNRAMQISLVKPQIKATSGELEQVSTAQEIVPIVKDLGFELGKGIAILMAGYIVLDTIRQVIVTVVDNKTEGS